MDEFDKIRKLRARVDQVADSLNLDRATFILVPGKDEDDNDIVQITFAVKVEAIESVDETKQRHVDGSFEQMLSKEFGDTDMFASEEKQAANAEEKAKTDALADEVEGWLLDED